MAAVVVVVVEHGWPRMNGQAWPGVAAMAPVQRLCEATD